MTIPLDNTTNGDIILEAAALEDASGLTVVDVGVAEVQDRTLLGLRRGWAAPQDIRPLGGFVIPAGTSVGEAYNLIVGIEAATASEDSSHAGVRFRYRHRETVHEHVFPLPLRLYAARHESCEHGEAGTEKDNR